jgi:hypothetical protein
MPTAKQTRPLVEKRTPGTRSLVLYEADEDGFDRVMLATSAADVVAAVERALAERIARRPADDEGGLQ